MGFTGLRKGSQNEKLYNLFFEEEKSIEEIAETLELPKNIVSSKISKLKSRISRGLIKKNIIDHRIRVQKSLSTDGENIEVVIEINDKFKNLLNEFAVEGTENALFYRKSITRKKIKSVLINSVNMNDLFYVLFTKEILENNKNKFKINNLQNFSNLMMNVNNEIPHLIRAMTELSRNQIVTVDFSVTSHSQTPAREEGNSISRGDD